METKIIKLLDGRDMTVYLKEHQPDRIDGNNLQLDTTGQYLSTIEHGFYKPDDDIIERGLMAFQAQIFRENAWFLYENADKIMSDSRMFFASVDTGSHLAYFGKGGFRHASIGVYLEWWLNFSNKSVDKNRNLIWYIAGSPLSGINGCCVLTPEGESLRMSGETSFKDVWRSFLDVNRLYSDTKQCCEAYSLEEVLVKLKGEDYKRYLQELKQECVDRTILYNNRPNWPQDGTDLKKKVKASRKTQMQVKGREIMSFYKSFTEDEEKLIKFEKEGNKEEYRKLLHNMAENSTQFITETFGRNVNRICLTDIINYAKYRKSLGYDE